MAWLFTDFLSLIPRIDAFPSLSVTAFCVSFLGSNFFCVLCFFWRYSVFERFFWVRVEAYFFFLLLRLLTLRSNGSFVFFFFCAFFFLVEAFLFVVTPTPPPTPPFLQTGLPVSLFSPADFSCFPRLCFSQGFEPGSFVEVFLLLFAAPLELFLVFTLRPS